MNCIKVGLPGKLIYLANSLRESIFREDPFSYNCLQEFQHGIVLALGHGFGRRALLTRMAKEGPEEWWESYR